ncbi:magnesium chelatase family protein [Thermodesulfitimonas autotrophica]|uniref:Magnesium chelatase family protein n=1 Tax=Thermodesulfitimonas autotrophica TaxID=1894989 RepID=A0A3N5APB8_9THEO|nr:YifB family Mg chelatase-like AAA ATPase [Thermodesulfitimonas autotrophica]RPF46803.1 magnesium chelatase family protein [Thermodesulfitimonas autotrophica]
MLAVVKSVALYGLQGYLVRVEVDVGGGLPAFEIVGLPDAAVREARDRVRAALKNAGFTFPLGRITVNLAPADIRKEGPGYDLALAAGILAATGQVPAQAAARFVYFGELSLDGTVRGVCGVLPAVAAAVDYGENEVVVAAANAHEAALVAGATVYPVENLQELAQFLAGERELPQPCRVDLAAGEPRKATLDFSEVRGQLYAKRALEVAAAGGHNVLMIGTPGTGKTMLARRLPTILPAMTFAEALEVTKIHSLAGLLPPGEPLLRERPFRAPHHTASPAALVGGGRYPRPGEVSLAHHGVLFLDEFPEFSKEALEALRQPLEDGIVTVSRAAAAVSFPARIMLVAAANPCPCGYQGDQEKECTCSPAQLQRYRSRLSGPLLDRIDICITVPRVRFEELAGEPAGESSAAVRQRVEGARAVQRERFRGTPVTCNAAMTGAQVRRFCGPTREAQRMLQAAFRQMALSARAYDRVLKVARTIADLEGAEAIGTAHIAEALQYREREGAAF